MIDHLRDTARDLGLPFGDRHQTFNTRLAQELGLWAASQGKGEVFHRLAFARYFADGANLAKIPVLVDIAKSAGLDEKEAETVLTTRSFSQAVDDDWNLSRLKGITAVPTFVIGASRLVGAQSYENLELLMLENDVPKLR